MKKKILISNTGTDMGGIEVSLMKFLSYISKKDYEIDLVLWKEDGILFNQIPKSVNIIKELAPPRRQKILQSKGTLNKVKNLLWYFVLRIFKFLKKPWLAYKKIHKDYDIAISYCQNGYSRYYIIDKVSAKKKYTWYHHGIYDNKINVYNMDKKYYAKMDAIISVSEPNKQMLSEVFPEIRDKICVINNLIDIEDIIKKSNEAVDDIKKENNIYTFVTVSRISVEKGIDIAINTAVELKKEGLKFIWYFVGDGDFFDEAKAMIKDLEVVDCCVLLGNKINPFPYVKMADLYIQTSYIESFGISILEALILKKIVVATRIPAINEILNYGDLGVLCDPDEHCFTNAIITLLQDNDKMKDYTSRIQRHIISNQSSYEEIDLLLEN